jgi:hypothetical protein
MLEEKINTIYSLESFLNTLQTIQECLSQNYPEAYKSLEEIISDEQASLKQEIQQYKQQLLQQAPNLNRDENYINSIWYQIDRKLYRIRKKLGFD